MTETNTHLNDATSNRRRRGDYIERVLDVAVIASGAVAVIVILAKAALYVGSLLGVWR